MTRKLRWNVVVPEYAMTRPGNANVIPRTVRVIAPFHNARDLTHYVWNVLILAVCDVWMGIM